MYNYHIWRAWYSGSYTMMAKPIRVLELHYPMIQFLIIILKYYILTKLIKVKNVSHHCVVVFYVFPKKNRQFQYLSVPFSS